MPSGNQYHISNKQNIKNNQGNLTMIMYLVWDLVKKKYLNDTKSLLKLSNYSKILSALNQKPA